MKSLFITLMILASFGLGQAAHADPSVSLEDDPIFSEGSDSTFADGTGSVEQDEGGSLEQAAERFSVSCYQDLGPNSACFEDYDSASCTSTRNSCRTAGAYSR